MKKQVIMVGMFALILSLTSYLFAFDIPAERMTEEAVFSGERISEDQEALPDGWTIPTGNLRAPKEKGTIEYVGSCLWRGMNDVFVTGDSLWCSFQDGLGLFDISDISNPGFLSRVYTPFSSTTIGYITGSNDILVEGNYAYIGDHTGVRIVNINNMELLSTYILESRAHDLYIRDNLLYVAAGSGLLVLDVLDPEVPDSVGFYAKPGAVGLDIVGNYAYVSDTGGMGLTILDISSPENPTFVSEYTTPGYGNELTVANGYAFIADHSNGLEIVDVNDPLNPVFKSHISTSGLAYDVKVDGDYAFVAATSKVDVVDISNLNAPSVAVSYTTEGSCKTLWLNGYLLFAPEFSFLEILNVQDPLNPFLEGSIERPYWLQEVRTSQNFAYIADMGDWVIGGLKIVDLSNPSIPFLKGKYPSGNTWAMPSVLDVSDNYVYIPDLTSSWVSTLQIIDVSNPDTPFIAGGYQASVKDVYVGGSLTYLLVSNKLRIMDLQDPLNPVLISSLTLGSNGRKICVDNGYAYIAADGQYTLWIVDVNNSSNPQLISTLTTACNYAREIVVQDNLLYLVCDHHLQIVDISDTNNPLILGSYDELYSAYGVYVTGDYAYIADGGILKIDVTDPSSPVLIEKYQVIGNSYGITGVYNYLYLTTESSFIVLKDDSISGIIGDFNDDGYVDAADLQLLGDHWHFVDTDPGWDALYDLVPDGIIDAADLQVFGDHWHEGTPPKSDEGSKDGKGPNADAGIVFDLDRTTYGNQNLTSIPSQPAGTYIPVDVYCTEVVNLDTYEFEVIYDPTELVYVSSSATNPITYEPNILTTNGGTALGWMVDSSTPGVLSIAYTLAGADPAQAPEGEGLIADIVFQALFATHGTLSFGDVYYYDSYGVVDLITDTGTATLPVELSSFTAIYNTVSGFVSLCWATASETDVNGFNIYRNTEDSFVDADKINVDLIAGSGTTTETTEYSFTDETADPYYTTYYYWLEVINFGGTNDKFGPYKYIPIDVNHDGELGIIPSALSSCYPNPARIGNEIKFNFRVGGLEGTARNVELKVYNILGKLVAEIVNGERLVNDYTETWRPDNLSNGVYFYQLKTDNYSEVKKMMLIR